MRALPDCDRVTIVWGYEYAIGALMMHLADRRVERLSAGQAVSGDLTRLGDLVSFIASGFRALAKRPRAFGQQGSAQQDSGQQDSGEV